MPRLGMWEPDRLTRAALAGPAPRVGPALVGLGYILDASRDQWRRHDLEESPLETAAQQVSWLLQHSGMAGILPAQELVHVADAIDTSPRIPQAARQLLHVAYLATHVTRRAAALGGLVQLEDSIQNVELGLDAALRGVSRAEHPSDLAAATSSWSQAAVAATRAPSPLTLQMTARGAATALVAVSSVAQFHAATLSEVQQEYPDRLTAPLKGAQGAWGALHDAWTIYRSPHERPDPQFLQATRELSHVVARVTADPAREDPAAGIAALTMLRHVAENASHGMDYAKICVPAETVAHMLADAYTPRARDMSASWARLERLAGQLPVPMPPELRQNLSEHSKDVTTAMTLATDGSYVLLGNRLMPPSTAPRSARHSMDREAPAPTLSWSRSR